MDKAIYTRYKTVRFEPNVFQLIGICARKDGVTTSEYIRNTVMKAVAEIYLEEALGPGASE